MRFHNYGLLIGFKDAQECSLPESDIQTDGKRLVRVKVIGGTDTADRERPCAMVVVLAKGRRVELSRDFDPTQLRRVVETLEGF